MKIRTQSIKILLLIASLLCLQTVAHSADDESNEQRAERIAEERVAQRWADAFKRLNTRNNITMVLTNRGSFYEVDHVIAVEVSGGLLVVKSEPTPNAYYYSIVYPGTIMLVKETPLALQPKKVEDKKVTPAVVPEPRKP